MTGEYERTFYGGQYASMAPLFEHYGVQLWMPQVGGLVDWHAEDHEQTMLALGLSSKREISDGTCPKAGSSPPIRRWSARSTSSLPRRPTRWAARRARRCAGT